MWNLHCVATGSPLESVVRAVWFAVPWNNMAAAVVVVNLPQTYEWCAFKTTVSVK